MVRLALAAFLVLNLFTSFAQVGSAATGSLIAGNPSCADVAPGATSSFKIEEPVSSGTYGDGTLRVTITVTSSANGNTFNWTSNIPVSFVIVKGGPNANGYDYRPGGATNDTGLHAPALASNGQWAGLSHVDFCYSAAASTNTPTSTPTRTPTETSVPPTSTLSSTPTNTPTQTRTRTPTPTDDIGVTPAATGTGAATATRTPNGGSGTGNIAIFKMMCDVIGQQDTCNGRDTSLSDYHVDFNVYAGSLPSGNPVQTLTVTLSDNAQGNGNTGNGSQGRIVGADLAIGVYTVCEVPRAYRSGFPDVSLIGVPRPTAGDGGSTGGSNQTQLPAPNEMCIRVQLTAGTAELKFLDARSQPLTVTPTATVTETPRFPTLTPTSNPNITPIDTLTPTRTNTPRPTNTLTNTPTITNTRTPTNTPTVTLTEEIRVTLAATLAPTITLTPSATRTPRPGSGNIAIFKMMCDVIGQQDTCNGRDTSLADYHVDFNVYAGPAPSGSPVQTLTVTLSDNAQGNGNTGNGSQGRVVGADLPVGVYTVCEVPLAYRTGFPDVQLIGAPRPTAGDGGSTGGSNQVQLAAPNDMCIRVQVSNGTAELKFLDARAVPLTLTPTASPTVSLTITPTISPTSSPTITPTLPQGTVAPALTATLVPPTETGTVPPTSTNTSVPTPTQSPLCVPNENGDMQGVITGVINGIAVGVVTNRSVLCSYSAGIASYAIGERGSEQTFFNGNTTVVPPGEQRTLTVTVPPCPFEVDLFRGSEIVVNGPNGNARYGARLMDLLLGGTGQCAPPSTPVVPNLTVPPTPTNTSVPGVTPIVPPGATPTATPPCCGGPVFLFFPTAVPPQLGVPTVTPIHVGFVPQQPPTPVFPPPPGFFPRFQGPQAPQMMQAPRFGGPPVMAGGVPVLSGVLPSIFPPSAPPVIAALPAAPIQSGVAGIVDIPEQPALPDVAGVSEQIRPAQLPNTGMATGGLDVLALIAGIMMIVGIVLAKVATRVRRRA